MREIKFRFWSNHFGMFVTPIDDIFVGALKDPDMNPMQFTGLTDRNGVEIYEGDILETPYDTFAVDDILPLRKDFWHKDDSDWWSYPEEVEVIGNIYENPELLATAQDMRKEQNHG